VNFQPHVDFPAGASPIAVAVGDLNKDGHPDLIVANYVNPNGTISVLLGNGDGSFGPPTSYAVGPNPQSIALGDFNNDANLDAAVANGDTVSVLLGNGDGTFAAPQDVLVGPYNRRVAIGDFNNDGKQDLAIIYNEVGLNNLAVALGNGDGTFGVPTTSSIGYYPTSLVVGDFDGNGKPDLAALQYNSAQQGTVSILLGNGNGTFKTPVNYQVPPGDPAAIAVGDFNRDRKQGLAVANGVPNSVSVLIGNGDGTFQAELEYGVGLEPLALAIADFNADGAADLAVDNYADGTVSVLLGDGTGGFAPSVDYSAGFGPQSVATGDLNGDAAIDLVTANVFAGTVSVLLNTGGTFVTTSSSKNPSKFGDPVTFTTTVTASLAGGGKTPTGQVQFVDNTTVLGTIPLANGEAQLTTSGLSSGKHNIKARYQGDRAFVPHSAPTIVQKVLPH
jgi:hypothetical protein